MKKLFLFFFSFLSLYSFSQSNFRITGRVIDAETKQPLQGASVFAQNTTIGTVTGSDGNFKIELPNGGYELAATFTNYYSDTKRVSNTENNDRELVFELKQKEKEMVDVIVKNSYEVADGWEKYGDFFLENFIGKTANSSQCVIKNKEALKFYFYKRRNRLNVLATAPLEIENAALGYKIKYTLDSFTHEYNTSVSLYSGSPLFEEMTTTDSAQKAKWDTARETAYKGSILHFMRSLYQKKLANEGFEIQFLISSNDRQSGIPLKDQYGSMNYNMDDSSHILEVRPNQLNVAILYKKEKPEASYLSINPDAKPDFQLSVVTFPPEVSLGIEQNGYYFEQNDITISGYWGWEKMADMVPYDYVVQGSPK